MNLSKATVGAFVKIILMDEFSGTVLIVSKNLNGIVYFDGKTITAVHSSGIASIEKLEMVKWPN